MGETNRFMSEAHIFTPESAEIANRLCDELLLSLSTPPTTSGRTAQDNMYLWQFEERLKEQFDVGEDFVVLASLSGLNKSLHQAMLAGYNPTDEQMANRDGWDFMWDEILELDQDHPDIAQWLDSYGYESELTPVRINSIGKHVIPLAGLKIAFSTLYLRGQDYCNVGFGFPRWSSNAEPNLTHKTSGNPRALNG